MATQTQTAPNDAASKSLDVKQNPQMNSSMTPKGMLCPDPSVHNTKNTALQDQASTTALYGTNAGRRDNYPLGADNKLSSAGAAASLKYARPEDLPSFPVVGIDKLASAGAAATLANSYKTSVEWSKPETSAAAGKAALLAKDYKMVPLWHPEASAAGSKAALLAHRDGGKLNLWIPEASADGNSAANIAMRTKGLSPETDYGYTVDGKKGALMAATGALSQSGRRRAGSTPVPPPSYPDSANSARNALSAATFANRPSAKIQNDSDRLGSSAMQAARIQHARGVPREMYGEHPPVGLVIEEQNHQNALRASALSMAKQMYEVQQRHIDEAAGRSAKSQGQSAAAAAHSRQPSTTDTDIKQETMKYVNLQEAAQKLAAERLAKIGIDDEGAFRSYYGYDNKPRSRLFLRCGRRRATSDPELVDLDDEEQSRRIRSQMSTFNAKLADLDAKKRKSDRQNLMAVAERKVQAQMHGMDERVFNETGKMSPAMMEEWDAKARAKAAAESEERLLNHGKVHIGGGKYLDQSEIDAVAAVRIQPTLDEINETAEKQRARDEEIRLDQEQQKREAQNEKQRAAELKAEEKRIKNDEKKALHSRNADGKAAARTEKEAERAKRAEEKRNQRDEKRRSKDPPKPAAIESPTAKSPTLPVADIGPDLSTIGAAATIPTAAEQNDELYRDPMPAAPPATRPATHSAGPNIPDAEQPKSTSEPTSPVSPGSPTKSDSKGLKSLFSKLKRRPKHSSGPVETEIPSFIGGAALTGASSYSTTQAAAPGATTPGATTAAREKTSHINYSPSISSLSSSASDDHHSRAPQRRVKGISAVTHDNEFEEVRNKSDEKLVPPPQFTVVEKEPARKGNPSRDSKFQEVL